MKKIALVLMQIYLFPIYFISKMLSGKRQRTLKLCLFQLLNLKKYYSESSFFPKNIENLEVKGTECDFSDTAVILQGPIITKDNFTMDSIKMYCQYYNNVKIIVSTWDDSNQDVVDRLRKMGICVLLNRYPTVNGVGNINYQLTTSLAGVKAAKEMGMRYVLKTRTDQRYYNPCALLLLQKMYMEGKLIMLGGVNNSFCTKCFQISDFMAFGEVSDMELLYSRPFDEEDTRNVKKTRKHQYENVLYFEEYIQMMRNAEGDIRQPIPREYQGTAVYYADPETLLAYGYFCAKEDISKYDTVQDAYDDFLRKYVIIVDADSLGFYWPKYTNGCYRRNYFDRAGKLDMGRWLSIIESEKKDS